MQPGITQIILPEPTTREFAAQAAAAGYEVVELQMKNDGDFNPHLSDTELRTLADDIRAAGMEPVSVMHGHCTGNLLDSGDAQRISIEETCKGLEVAKTMGIGSTLHTLGRFSAELYYDDAYANAVDSLKEIAKTAESLKVQLAVEQIWNGFLFSPMEMRRFLDEIDSDYIGFYFDPGNMAVFHFPQHWVRIVGHRTKMVHLKDWKGNALNGEWTPLLEGNVDFAAVNKELRAIGYDGPMISEVAPSLASIEDTAKAIRKIIEM